MDLDFFICIAKAFTIRKKNDIIDVTKDNTVYLDK